jgi:hypothetical protein
VRFVSPTKDRFKRPKEWKHLLDWQFTRDAKNLELRPHDILFDMGLVPLIGTAPIKGLSWWFAVYCDALRSGSVKSSHVECEIRQLSPNHHIFRYDDGDEYDWRAHPKSNFIDSGFSVANHAQYRIGGKEYFWAIQFSVVAATAAAVDVPPFMVFSHSNQDVMITYDADSVLGKHEPTTTFSDWDSFTTISGDWADLPSPNKPPKDTRKLLVVKRKGKEAEKEEEEEKPPPKPPRKKVALPCKTPVLVDLSKPTSSTYASMAASAHIDDARRDVPSNSEAKAETPNTPPKPDEEEEEEIVAQASPRLSPQSELQESNRVLNEECAKKGPWKNVSALHASPEILEPLVSLFRHPICQSINYPVGGTEVCRVTTIRKQSSSKTEEGNESPGENTSQTMAEQDSSSEDDESWSSVGSSPSDKSTDNCAESENERFDQIADSTNDVQGAGLIDDDQDETIMGRAPVGLFSRLMSRAPPEDSDNGEEAFEPDPEETPNQQAERALDYILEKTRNESAAHSWRRWVSWIAGSDANVLSRWFSKYLIRYDSATAPRILRDVVNKFNLAYANMAHRAPQTWSEWFFGLPPEPSRVASCISMVSRTTQVDYMTVCRVISTFEGDINSSTTHVEGIAGGLAAGTRGDFFSKFALCGTVVGVVAVGVGRVSVFRRILSSPADSVSSLLRNLIGQADTFCEPIAEFCDNCLVRSPSTLSSLVQTSESLFSQFAQTLRPVVSMFGRSVYENFPHFLVSVIVAPATEEPIKQVLSLPLIRTGLPPMISRMIVGISMDCMGGASVATQIIPHLVIDAVGQDNVYHRMRAHCIWNLMAFAVKVFSPASALSFGLSEKMVRAMSEFDYEDKGRLFCTPNTFLRQPRLGVPVMSVCTGANVLPSVMPGNSVTYQPLPCDADRTVSYEPLIACKGVVVYSFAPCQCNLLNCLFNRMAGIPKRYKNSPDPSRDRAQVCQAIAQFRIHVKIWKLAYRGWIDRDTPFQISEEDWLLRYPANQRKQILRDGEQRDNPNRRSFDFMVKIERNTFVDFDGPTPLFQGIQILDPDKHVRGIFIPPNEQRLYGGPECHHASKYWGSIRCGRICYSVGTTEFQRVGWFEKALSSREFCLIYAGDNFVVCEDNFCWFGDLSRMDMHVTPTGGELSQEILLTLAHFGTAGMLAGQKIKRLRHKDKKVSATIVGTQPSGRCDTTINNSPQTEEICQFAHFTSLETGLPMSSGLLIRAAHVFGHVLKLERHPKTHVYLGDYLQQRLLTAVVDGRVTRHPANKLGRILLKTFWTRERLSKKKQMGLMRAISLSLIKQNRHNPILIDLLERILFLTQGYKLHYDIDLRSKIRGWLDMDQICSYNLQEHPNAIIELSEIYDLPVSRLVQFRRYVSRIDPPLILKEEFADVYQRLALKDL